MTFSWFCQGLLLPLQHHLKVVPFSNIFWGIFTLLSTDKCMGSYQHPSENSEEKKCSHCKFSAITSKIL